MDRLSEAPCRLFQLDAFLVLIVEVALVAGLALGMVYVLGRLLRLGVGVLWAVDQATGAANERLRHELADLSVPALRDRLLRNPYLALRLRNHPDIQALRERVARGDELALLREYPRRRLYKLLVVAERAAVGRPDLAAVGRPEAMDNIGEVWALLQALAQRRAVQQAVGAGERHPG